MIPIKDMLVANSLSLIYYKQSKKTNRKRKSQYDNIDTEGIKNILYKKINLNESD